MNYKEIRLRTDKGIGISLLDKFDSILEVEDAVEDSKDSKDLLSRLKKTKNYFKLIELDRENEDMIRFKCVACLCGNECYLIVNK